MGMSLAADWIRHLLRWMKFEICLLYRECFIEEIWPWLYAMLEAEQRKLESEGGEDVH